MSDTTQADMNDNRTNNPGRTLKTFIWYAARNEGYPHIQTLNDIRSLASGTATIMELIEADNLNEGDLDCFGAVLNDAQKGALLRLAIVTNNLIADMCDRSFDWTAKHGMDRIRDIAKGA